MIGQCNCDWREIYYYNLSQFKILLDITSISNSFSFISFPLPYYYEISIPLPSVPFPSPVSAPISRSLFDFWFFDFLILIFLKQNKIDMAHRRNWVDNERPGGNRPRPLGGVPVSPARPPCVCFLLLLLSLVTRLMSFKTIFGRQNCWPFVKSIRGSLIWGCLFHSFIKMFPNGDIFIIVLTLLNWIFDFLKFFLDWHYNIDIRPTFVDLQMNWGYLFHK